MWMSMSCGLMLMLMLNSRAWRGTASRDDVVLQNNKDPL